MAVDRTGDVLRSGAHALVKGGDLVAEGHRVGAEGGERRGAGAGDAAGDGLAGLGEILQGAFGDVGDAAGDVGGVLVKRAERLGRRLLDLGGQFDGVAPEPSEMALLASSMRLDTMRSCSSSAASVSLPAPDTAWVNSTVRRPTAPMVSSARVRRRASTSAVCALIASSVLAFASTMRRATSSAWVASAPVEAALAAPRRSANSRV
ncbi:MAG: hypothetical protein HZY79_10990 [Rhodoblastus sp.]|nr:MAG: hypothetical protein HZY79_10990 [Rhodoblastus sp.]